METKSVMPMRQSSRSFRGSNPRRAGRPARPVPVEPPAFLTEKRPVMWRPLIVALVLTLIAFAPSAAPYLRTFLPAAPLALATHCNSGQLNITWDANAVVSTAALEIIDGERVTNISVTPDFSGITYIP